MNYIKKIRPSPDELKRFMVQTFDNSLSVNALIEKNARLEFMTRYGIALKSQELLGFYETYKPSPRQFLDMINQIRHDPKELKTMLEKVPEVRKGAK